MTDRLSKKFPMKNTTITLLPLFLGHASMVCAEQTGNVPIFVEPIETQQLSQEMLLDETTPTDSGIYIDEGSVVVIEDAPTFVHDGNGNTLFPSTDYPEPGVPQTSYTLTAEANETPEATIAAPEQTAPVRFDEPAPLEAATEAETTPAEPPVPQDDGTIKRLMANNIDIGAELVFQHYSSKSRATDEENHSTDPFYTLDFYAYNDDVYLYLDTWQGEETDLILYQGYAGWHAIKGDKLWLSYGKQRLSFGEYTSILVSDPLTEILGSIFRDQVIKAYSSFGQFWTTLYAYEGIARSTETGKKHGIGHGINAGYWNDHGYIAFDYTSNIAESAEFGPNNVRTEIPGLAIHSSIKFGRFKLKLQHVTALEDLAVGDLGGDITIPRKPSASEIQLDIEFSKGQTVALAWNETRNTEELYSTTDYAGIGYQKIFSDKFKLQLEAEHFKNWDGTKEDAINIKATYKFLDL